MARNIFIWT